MYLFNGCEVITPTLSCKLYPNSGAASFEAVDIRGHTFEGSKGRTKFTSLM